MYNVIQVVVNQVRNTCVTCMTLNALSDKKWAPSRFTVNTGRLAAPADKSHPDFCNSNVCFWKEKFKLKQIKSLENDT